MSDEKRWREKLSDRVVVICERQGIRESDCEPLVKSWLEHIHPEVRPTVGGVIMGATRKIWNLKPID